MADMSSDIRRFFWVFYENLEKSLQERFGYRAAEEIMQIVQEDAQPLEKSILNRTRWDT